MAYRSLADFLEALAQQNQLAHVVAEVEADLEIAEITRRASRCGGPALLFNRIRGQSLAVVTNLLGTEARLCLALGIDSISELSGRLENVFARSASPSWLDRLKTSGEPVASEKFRPRFIKSAPCQQVVRLGRDVDLAALPLLKCWPDESARSITAAQVTSSDVEARERAVSLAHLQAVDRQRLAIADDLQGNLGRHWAGFQARGEKMPLAVVLGCDPAHLLSATLPAPPEIDGYLLAGALRGMPVDVTKCRMHALEVPAEADVVLEGYVDPLSERATVAAGGWNTGHYRPPQPALVMEVAAVTQRTNPAIPLIVPSTAGGEASVLLKARERLLLPLVKGAIPELVDYSLAGWGGDERWAIVSVRKTYPGQARKVASAVWGLAALQFSKFVIVVGETVDVHSAPSVLAAIGANVHPGRDVFFQHGPGRIFDHSSPTPGLGQSLGIDATAKLPAEHQRPWPAELAASPEIAELVSKRWSEYGLGDGGSEMENRD